MKILRGRLKHAVVAGVSLIFLFLTQEAAAVPRFAVQNGAKCVLCHVNPTGGGLRNDYGREIFARRRLSVEWPNAKPPVDSSLGGFSGRLNDTFQIGGDLRFAYLYVSDEGFPDDDQDLDTFFLMQGDVYLGAALSKNVTVYSDLGLGNAIEVFALAHSLPHGLYVKAGAFTPPFGWKFPEHTNVNRVDLNFDPGVVDTGIEVGRAGDKVGAHLMFSAGQLSRGVLLSNGLLFRGNYALSGVLDYTVRTERLGLTLALSAAFDHDQGQTRTRLVSQNLLRTSSGREFDPLGVERFREMKVGGSMGLAVGRLWYLAELDFVRNPVVPNEIGQAFLDEVAGDQVLAPVGYLSYQEVGIGVIQGLDVYAAFEYHDPDAAIRADPQNPAATDPVFRSGVFVEFFPLDNVELTALVRRNSAGLLGLRQGSTDAVFMVHLFY